MGTITASHIRCNAHQVCLFRHWKRNNFSDARHVSRALEITGPFDSNLFKKVTQDVFASQYASGLRYRECLNGQVAFYYKRPAGEVTKYHCIEHTCADAARRELELYKARFFIRPFNLHKGEAFHMDLVFIPTENKYHLLVNCHNIFCDDQGISELLQKLASLYNKQARGEEPPLHDNAAHFLHVIKHQDLFGNSCNPPPGQQPAHAWLPQTLRLPEKVMKGVQNGPGFPEEAIERYCQAKQLSPFVFFLTCYQLLFRLAVPEEQIITVINNRCLRAQRQQLLLGPFDAQINCQSAIMSATTIEEVFTLLHAVAGCEPNSCHLYRHSLFGFMSGDAHTLLTATDFYLQDAVQPDFTPEGCEVKSLQVSKRSPSPAFAVITTGQPAMPCIAFNMPSLSVPANQLRALFMAIMQEIVINRKQRIEDIDVGAGAWMRNIRVQAPVREQALLKAS